MSAPEIPNLLNKLRSERGGRTRGPGPRAWPGRGRDERSKEEKDRTVQSTDEDASNARWSAVRRGYILDDYARFFVEDPNVTKYPIINRGTYVRTSALDYLVRLFFSIDMDKPKQVISLGAGSDTRYFRLRSQYPELKIHYHELDFPANTRSKIAIIRRKPSPLDLLDQNDDKLQWSSHESNHALRFSAEGDALYSPAGGYNIHPLDLRTLAAEDSVLPALPGLDPKLPTIILSEMCLCYLTPEETQAVMRSLTKSYLSSNTPVSIILYEPVRPFDAFGKVMVSNLASRQITLPTLSAYPTLSSQKRRLKEADFTSGQGAADINRVWDRWIPPEEKIRVDRCEGLDEVEEWVMLAQHYCIAWGWRDGAEKGDASGDAEAMVFSRAWRGVIGEEVDDDLPGPAHGGLRNPFKDT